MTKTPTRDLYHKDGCSADPAKVRDFIGRQGDPMRGCLECRRFVVNPDQPAPPELAPEPQKVLSPYRCRDHHDQPVTAKGKGCTACRTSRQQGKAA